MAATSVEAVWVWRYSTAPFKAAYGRLPGTTYSKDFLQASGDCASVLSDVFGRSPGSTVELDILWPGGARKGLIFEAADFASNGRLNLRWETDHAPDPWRLFPEDDPNPIKTFPGDPHHTTSDAADEELAKLQARNLDPWIVVVKLHGDPASLHARAYLGSPPPELAHSSTRNLPQQVQDLIADLPTGRNCAVLTAPRCGSVRAPRLMRSVLDALRTGPNVLLVGPPGTGKTVVLEDLRSLFEVGSAGLLFDPERFHDAWSSPEPAPTGPVRTLVFHPSYSYEEFVIGLYPKASATGIDLEARPGPLLSLAHWASSPNQSALLVADEFNRGNAAAIFGDTLALLDKEKRSDPSTGVVGAAIDRPYPEESVQVAAEFANDAGTTVPPQLTLPSNLWIVGAMNSSDRSVAPLDAALRRRFSIVRVDPDYDVLADRYRVQSGASVRADDPASWSASDVQVLALNLLRSLNNKVELILGSDFLLGHALLWDVDGATAEVTIHSLAIAFDERIVASLRMTFADQDDPLGALLGAGTSPTGASGASSSPFAEWVMPPTELAAIAPPRLRLHPASELAWTAAAVGFRDLT